MRWNILVMLTHLWEPSQRKVLLKGWIVPEVLEVECLLSGSELLGWLAGLRLGLKVRVELLLLGLPLLLGLVVPEAKQGVSELWRIEERVDAIDERLEERSWKKKTQKFTNLVPFIVHEEYKLKAWGFTCIEKTDRIPNICLTIIKISNIKQTEHTKFDSRLLALDQGCLSSRSELRQIWKITFATAAVDRGVRGLVGRVWYKDVINLGIVHIPGPGNMLYWRLYGQSSHLGTWDPFNNTNDCPGCQLGGVGLIQLSQFRVWLTSL